MRVEEMRTFCFYDHLILKQKTISDISTFENKALYMYRSTCIINYSKWCTKKRNFINIHS